MKFKIGIAAVFLIVAFLVGGIAYTTINGRSATDSSETATDVTSIGNLNAGEGYTITPIPYEDWHDYMPSLDRGVQFSATVPESARAILTSKAKQTQENLLDDPSQISDWLDLAIVYHTGNDFNGAREVWEFLVKAIPNDTTPYDNLGRLYHFDLKDFEKAEYYFKKSIEIQPNVIGSYLELHTLYAYSYKTDTTLAADILEQAAKRFPKESDPLALLGTYWRDKGDSAKARAAYTRALDRAREANNVTLINSIGEELARLPE